MKYLIWRINRTLSSSYTNIKYGIKSFIYWFLLIVRDRPWDYVYLLELEKHKLQQMLEYHKQSKLVVGYEFIIRDLSLCIRLIDVVIQDDMYFTGYINTKNAYRFVKEFNIELSKELRIEKAWCLYNKIRTYRAFTWWD